MRQPSERHCEASRPAIIAVGRHHPTPLIDIAIDDSWSNLNSVLDARPCQFATCFRFSHTDDLLLLDIVAQCQQLCCQQRQHNDPMHEDDVLEVFLEPPPKKRNVGHRYLELQVSPPGIMFDAWVTNRTEFLDPNAPRLLELSHNPIGPDASKVEVLLDGVPPARFSHRQFAAGIEVKEWRVRFSIPFRVFGHRRSAHSDALRINVFRIQQIGTHREYQSWIPTGRLDFHRPDHFGNLLLGSTEALCTLDGASLEGDTSKTKP